MEPNNMNMCHENQEVYSFFPGYAPSQYVRLRPYLWKVVDDLEYPWYILRAPIKGWYVTKNQGHIDFWIARLYADSGAVADMDEAACEEWAIHPRAGRGDLARSVSSGRRASKPASMCS
jgi:hypothetical protein